jgi:hypothetical protein
MYLSVVWSIDVTSQRFSFLFLASAALLLLACASDESQPLSYSQAVTTATDICMEDKWNAAGNSQGLNCTAKEVYIEELPDGSKIIDAEIVDGDGCAYPGDTATVNIIADIHFNSDRYDVGVYTSLDGGDALTGTCGVDVLNPLAPPPAFDADGDACGDVDTPGGGATFDTFAFQTLTVTCEDTDFDGFLDLGTCFSWRTNGNNELCTAAGDVYPGTPSKCFCERVNIPVPVPPAELQMTKIADPETVDEPGGWVTFTVSMVNTGVSPLNDVTLFSLVDDVHGDLNGQGDCSVPQDIPGDGGSYSCSFTAFVSGQAGYVETDTITASGIDTPGNQVTAQASATVTVLDVPSSITITKTALTTSLPEPGGDFDFQVVVVNTSLVDSVTISDLDDTYLSDLQSAGTCSIGGVAALPPFELDPGDTLTCLFTVNHTGQPGDSFTNNVTVTATDDDGQDAGGTSNDQTVTIEDVPAVPLTIVKSTSTPSLPEPGGDFQFSVVITNGSTVDSATVTSLNDTFLADLPNNGSCTDAAGATTAPFVLSPGESMTCTFTVSHTGDPATFDDVVTVAATDDDGADVGGVSNQVTVEITNVPPTANLTKTIVEALVTYQVVINNTSSFDDLSLNALQDDMFGDVFADQNSGNPDIVSTTCAATTLVAGGTYTCSFDAIVNTSPHTNTVSATVIDNEGTAPVPVAVPSDSATITFDQRRNL